jgi:hypothetical protein
MVRDQALWDKDMAAARRNREIRVASEHHHHIYLAWRRAGHARQTDNEGSNAHDVG